MGAQECRPTGAAGLLGVGLEALPEGDGFVGVVASAGHVDEADVIGFGFLRAAVGQFKADFGSDAIGDLGDALPSGIGGGDGGAEDLAAGLHEHGLAYAFAAVTCGGVSHFVADDSGKANFGFGNGEDAGVDADLAAGEAEGVGFLAFEDDKFPVGIGHVRGGDAGDLIAHALDHGVQGGVLVDGGFFLQLFETGEAEFHFLAGGDQCELVSTGDRDC